MKVLVQQPQFLPWIGYWNKVWASDLSIIYAGVDFCKNGDGNRVKTPQGWLTLPVSHGLATPISKVRFDTSCLPKMARTIRQQYMSRRQPYGARLEPLAHMLEDWAVEGSPKDSLLEIQLQTTLLLGQLLGIETRMRVDIVERPGTKHEKLGAALCSLPPCTLMSGAGGRSFGYESVAGVEQVLYQNVRPEADPHSILGLIANHEYPLQVVSTAATWSKA